MKLKKRCLWTLAKTHRLPAPRVPACCRCLPKRADSLEAKRVKAEVGACSSLTSFLTAAGSLLTPLRCGEMLGLRLSGPHSLVTSGIAGSKVEDRGSGGAGGRREQCGCLPAQELCVWASTCLVSLLHSQQCAPGCEFTQEREAFCSSTGMWSR